uniref:Uncharacterized protein n=1 Tax=Cannabis sativa TaxID=3483 RepID=A0A803PTI1_CANSA
MPWRNHQPVNLFCNGPLTICITSEYPKSQQSLPVEADCHQDREYWTASPRHPTKLINLGINYDRSGLFAGRTNDYRIPDMEPVTAMIYQDRDYDVAALGKQLGVRICGNEKLHDTGQDVQHDGLLEGHIFYKAGEMTRIGSGSLFTNLTGLLQEDNSDPNELPGPHFVSHHLMLKEPVLASGGEDVEMLTKEAPVDLQQHQRRTYHSKSDDEIAVSDPATTGIAETAGTRCQLHSHY